MVNGSTMGPLSRVIRRKNKGKNMRIIKPNRRGGPKRVTQRGTKTSYAQPNFRAYHQKRNRWAQ